MVRTITLYGMPGGYTVSDPQLAFTKQVLTVERNGLRYNLTYNEEAVNRQYVYSSGAGVIGFDPNIPFTGPAPDLPVSPDQLEKIFVIYEI